MEVLFNPDHHLGWEKLFEMLLKIQHFLYQDGKLNMLTVLI